MLSKQRPAHARYAFVQSLASLTLRRFASARTGVRSKLTAAHLRASTPIAKELLKTNVWYTRPLPKSTKGKAAATSSTPVTGDRFRVNVVDEKLCDDILAYIGPTLQRHVGCDLVDINPGAGLWSSKLHDFLQPRSHMLMEPDADLYRPFLEPLLSRPGTKLVPQSGILWKELTQALNYIDQEPRARASGIEPQRNDALLVTANLAYFPKKRYLTFDSVVSLVLYQLLSSVQTGQLFQKYGLVRMLIWTGTKEHNPFLAKCIQTRKKASLEAEFACEWIAEVATSDEAQTEGSRKTWHVRDKWIDVDSSLQTMKRMREQGLEIPKGRKTGATTQAEPYARDGKTHAGLETPFMDKSYFLELEALEDKLLAGAIKKEYKSPEWARLVKLRYLAANNVKDGQTFLDLFNEMRRLGRLRAEGTVDEAELEALEEQWNDAVLALRKNTSPFRLVRDNLHVFEQDPPAMLWDRRPYEPLAVKDGEFFPAVGCSLLDIQPKAMHPLLMETGRGSTRAADHLDILQRSMMGSPLDPASKAIEKIWPGAAEAILPKCPSLTDPKQGGSPGKGEAALTVRVLNEKQWMEILQAYMEWPFRPTYEELIGRLADDVDSAGDEDVGGGNSMSPGVSTGIMQ
ncbi:hypothetical protein Cob_v008770 [Colletotrichum orbiculare MAFF 240422]|uniref:Mitochondrial transcription factor 1 n=1 Tax=Colletotrichum orbiculare (strain 104-T / ATCC 96160 / CBS 514.97 / LARS 414 / MAFF 240422) TaxID=1213857 RepID=N4V1L3_COLOR|nr:hypothetical protein Cob_v008770 [Colletotrichum orbiculare MAFF 240422]